jgi:fructoselysine-6-phosphate deglycase
MATDMLSFDADRYLRIQSGAVGLADEIDALVRDALGSGATNVVFAGAGGAGILMQPAASLLRERSTFPAQVTMPAELVVTGSATLGRDSLVVIPSLSGTTAESLAALDHAKSAGAQVVVLTANGDSPLARKADVSLVNFAEDDTSCESFYVQSLLLALSVLAARGELEDHRAVVAELQRLPQLLLAAKSAFEPRARQVAEAIAADTWHIVTGAGNTWPEASYYGMCILEEMQWIRTRPVHASDFFHGTLELVEPDVSVLLLKGEDATRPLAERVERFVSGLTDRLLVVDSAGVALPGISQSTLGLVSPVVLAAMLERVSAHVEALRDHPLTTRRYYRRVAY